MEFGTLLEAESCNTVVHEVARTTNAWDRLRGLLGRPQLEADEGLLITPCNSVHMLFMRYPVDVVYLDQTLTVIKIVDHLKPWRASWAWGAEMALELPAGGATAAGLAPGKRLQWQKQ